MDQHFVWEILNSNFSASFFGAVGGSAVIILLDYFNRQRKILADINTSIGVLTIHTNTLLLAKAQHVVCVVENYRENKEKYDLFKKYKTNKGTTEIFEPQGFQIYLKQFSFPKLDFDLPLDRVFGLTDKYPKIVPIILQTKLTLRDVEHSFGMWNQLTKEIHGNSAIEIIHFMFGADNRKESNNTYYIDTIFNLEGSLNSGLFFTRRAIQILSETGKDSLPFWLKKKVTKMEFTKEEYKKLMPPENYKEDWF